MKIRCKIIVSEWIYGSGYSYESTIDNQVYDITDDDWEKHFLEDDDFSWWEMEEQSEDEDEDEDTKIETVYSLVEDGVDEWDEKILKTVTAWESDIVDGRAQAVYVERG